MSTPASLELAWRWLRRSAVILVLGAAATILVILPAISFISSAAHAEGEPYTSPDEMEATILRPSQRLNYIPLPDLYQSARALDGTHGGQCVEFLQRFLGMLDNCRLENCNELPLRGNAADIPPNVETPAIGRIVLFARHVALIVGMDDGELILLESNFERDEKVRLGRRVDSEDPSIRGYFDAGKVKVESIIAEVSAYSSSRDETDHTPFITASQSRVHPGTLACPRSIPFGTRVMIEGQAYVCEDRLAPEYDRRFDIWKESKDEALGHGVRRLEVYLISTE